MMMSLKLFLGAVSFRTTVQGGASPVIAIDPSVYWSLLMLLKSQDGKLNVFEGYHNKQSYAISGCAIGKISYVNAARSSKKGILPSTKHGPQDLNLHIKR